MRLLLQKLPTEIRKCSSKPATGNGIIMTVPNVYPFAKVSIRLEDFQKHFVRQFEYWYLGNLQNV